jgi:hypothetical protein
MKKQIIFQRLIEKERKYLIKQGFNPSTLTMYAKGKRNPKIYMANKLSIALKLPLKKIPYIVRQFVRNE